MKIGSHRRRHRRSSRLLRPVDVLVPVRVPEGTDLEDDAEGDRAARVRAELTGRTGSHRSPFDPSQNGSFHATHVAGIAAGDHNTQDGALFLSGVAPDTFLGNYKALTIPTPASASTRNSSKGAAAIEAAMADGMNVINLSLGKPEISPRSATSWFFGDRRGGGGRRRARDRGGQPVRPVRLRLDQLRRRMRPARSRLRRRHSPGTIADFSSVGPSAGLAPAEAGRRRHLEALFAKLEATSRADGVAKGLRGSMIEL